MQADKDSLKHFRCQDVADVRHLKCLLKVSDVFDVLILLYVITCFFASQQHSIDYLT